MTFYSVLGGYCIYYVIINLIGIFGGMPDSSSFGALLTNPWISIGVLLLFMVICFLINRGGISGGSSPTTMTSYAIPVRPRRIDSSAASRQGRRLLGMMMDARWVMVLALPPPVVP